MVEIIRPADLEIFTQIRPLFRNQCLWSNSPLCLFQVLSRCLCRRSDETNSPSVVLTRPWFVIRPLRSALIDFHSPEDAKSSSHLERSVLADFLTSFCNCSSTFQFPFIRASRVWFKRSGVRELIHGLLALVLSTGTYCKGAAATEEQAQSQKWFTSTSAS